MNEMAVLLINSGPGNTSGMACTRMIILSVLFHCMIFSFVLFVPGYTPDRKIGDAVYEVNLVELPPKTPLKKTVKAATKRRVAKERHAPAKRITKPKKKEKPVVIAKRSMTQKSHKLKRRKKSSSRLIDQAVAKIEKKVRAEKNHVEQEMARLASRAKDRDVKQVLGRGSENGITIRIYKMEVEDRVKSNWSYPVALVNSGSLKALEATVVIKVKSDGTILKSWFKRRSSDVIFNDSVMKAIDRSVPLPPFPEGYRKSYDEIEINFNLSELENVL